MHECMADARARERGREGGWVRRGEGGKGVARVEERFNAFPR